MAASSINITKELYTLLETDLYETDVQMIEDEVQPSPEDLKKIKKVIDKWYKLDTSRFQTRRGNITPNGMFELFSDYSGMDIQTVRDDLYAWLQDKNNDIRSVVTAAMSPMPHLSLSGWLMTMRNLKYASSELTLYALCKMYRRHAVIFTMTGLWTMIKDGVVLDEKELLKNCDIVLLYLGKTCLECYLKLRITNTV